MKLRVFEAFAGYGSQRMALENLGIKHEIVATSEVDEYAILSYGAIHGNNLDKELSESEEVIKEYLTKLNVPLTDKGKLKNLSGKRLRRFYNALEQSKGLGDISKIDVNEVPDHDLFTYSFPCQDISVAGDGKGFAKGSGTRSGLLWECERIIETKKPKYLLMENVKNLVSKKFMPGFKEWQDYLTSLGYTNYWEVLNAKDFGIPQNRERVFMVSILGEHKPYVFPKPIKLKKRLKDVLEDEVDERYYLDDERKNQLVVNLDKVQSSIVEGVPIKNNTKQGYIMAKSGDGVDLSYPTSNTRRGRVQKEKSQTLTTDDSKGVVEIKLRQVAQYDTDTRKNSNRFRTYDSSGLSPTLGTMQGGGLEPHIIQKPRGYNKGGEHKISPSITSSSWQENNLLKDNYRIRKLTPLECWRLMDVKDEDFYKAQKVNSNTQLYKQAGNSIVVSVLEAIFRNMFQEAPDKDMTGENIPLF